MAEHPKSKSLEGFYPTDVSPCKQFQKAESSHCCFIVLFPELLLALPDAEKDLGVEECEDDEGDDARGQQPRPHPVVRYVVLVPTELGDTNLEQIHRRR